jgi:rRNA maturation endonuclease Nob1
MFQKKPFYCDLPEGAPQYRITKVVRKTDGDSIDSATVSDFSSNFKDFLRELESENFSIPAQQASGLSMKEVNSVLLHDSELSDAEIQKINAELERKEEPVEPLNE